MPSRRAAALGQLYVGTAGWTLPRDVRAEFPAQGTHLERYAQRLPAVEINSTFYRPHRPATFARWAESVPATFRFSVKIPQAITHDRRLQDVGGLLTTFLGEIAPLGERLGCLLVQLPPSFAWHRPTATAFFKLLQKQGEVPVACEPRHASWFEPSVEKVLRTFKIARVAADPAKVPSASLPGGWPELVYYRLHGSPRTYYSAYSPESLATLAEQLRLAARQAKAVWCIFDNTALGAAAPNALQLQTQWAQRAGP